VSENLDTIAGEIERVKSKTAKQTGKLAKLAKSTDENRHDKVKSIQKKQEKLAVLYKSLITQRTDTVFKLRKKYKIKI